MSDELKTVTRIHWIEKNGWRLSTGGDSTGDWLEISNDSLRLTPRVVGTLDCAEAFINGWNAAREERS